MHNGVGSEEAGEWGICGDLLPNFLLPQAGHLEGGNLHLPPAVLAAARSLRDAEQARQQRRQRIEELLAAEGLQQYAGTSATYRYVQYGDGTEEGAVEAARARAAQEAAAAAARAARLAEVQAALAAEDIPYASVQHSHQLDYFVSHGTGTMEAGGCWGGA